MNAKRADKIINIYLLIVTFLLAVGLFYLNGKIDKLSLSLGETIVPQTNLAGNNGDTCGPNCQTQIEDAVGRATASLSGSARTPLPRPTATAVPTAAPKTQTSYIPLAGPITTTSTDWVDAPGTDTSIDLVNDYGSGTKISWDAFLSVANSNGQAFARLFDVTHGIAVDNSVISVTDNSALTQVTSGYLNLWSGRNTYRVQIKSLNSFTVTFGSGRMKIVY